MWDFYRFQWVWNLTFQLFWIVNIERKIERVLQLSEKFKCGYLKLSDILKYKILTDFNEFNIWDLQLSEKLKCGYLKLSDILKYKILTDFNNIINIWDLQLSKSLNADFKRTLTVET